MFTDATCNATPDDSVVGDAMLGPLGDNGGPTLTHLPAPGSPAIDGGDDAQCLATDQRGVGRPIGSCDAGSVEQ